MCDPLRFGKIFGRQTLTRAAEFQVALGWNFLRESWYHAGFALRAAAPTGNRPDAEFLFEPIIGNGGHWELGIGLTSHVQVYSSDDDIHRLALYCDANITHLFDATQKRSFDFTKNGNGSRYILLEDIAAPSQNLFVGMVAGDPAENQYQRRLMPAINKTTFDVKIDIAAQADIVLKLAYQYKNFEFDLGYNFYGRSKEKINRCQTFESNRFGFKGDAQIYGFGDVAEIFVPLNATQSNATIRAGQGEGNANFANMNADNPKIAFSATEDLQSLTTVDANLLKIDFLFPARLSDPAILLKDEDLNICGALLPHAISHKIFVHFNHAWRQHESFTPYLGVGAAGEWACICFKNNSAHSQWGVWLKGGISY